MTTQTESLTDQPAQTDWEAVAADQAMTIAMLKAELQELAEWRADAVEVELTESGWLSDGVQRPAQQENLYAYAGVKIWVGNTQVAHFISRTAIEHEAIKGMCLHIAADWCLQEIKAKT